MQVVMIGTGNVATVLSKLIVAKGHTLLEVAGRNYDHALQIAQPLNAIATSDFSAIDKTADIYIIAVNDDAIKAVIHQLHLQDKLVIHTAGASTKHLLQSLTSTYGVLWPLQTLRKETAHQLSIPLVIDGSDKDTLATIESFAKSLSQQVSNANDEERVKLHVSAVVVSNFTNHLYALAEDYCMNEGLDFNLLFPLMEETVQRTNYHSPKEVQTGPAIRNDILTMNKHISLLENYPTLNNIYKKISESILISSNKK